MIDLDKVTPVFSNRKEDFFSTAKVVSVRKQIVLNETGSGQFREKLMSTAYEEALVEIPNGRQITVNGLGFTKVKE